MERRIISGGCSPYLPFQEYKRIYSLLTEEQKDAVRWHARRYDLTLWAVLIEYPEMRFGHDPTVKTSEVPMVAD